MATVPSCVHAVVLATRPVHPPARWPPAAVWATLVAVESITVFLADDSVIIREGVKAMLARETDLAVVGVAEDYDGLVAGAEAAAPQVIVSDIRMPPTFQREGIEACQQIRKPWPCTPPRTR